MADKGKSIIVHTCCAACASYLFMELQKEDFVPIAYFSNPSLKQKDQSDFLSGIDTLCEVEKLNITAASLDQEEYHKLVSPFKDQSSLKFINDQERLERKCREVLIELILQKTVERAVKLNVDSFTTSMLCSPYRDHNTIWDIGTKIAQDRGLKFVYKDFRKGYWMGRNYARKYDLIIPTYCSDYLK